MGKAAPPSPTIPASLTMSIISPPEMDSMSLSLTFSHSSLPSLVINTDSISPPDGCGCVSIFFTSPDTGECILADYSLNSVPISIAEDLNRESEFCVCGKLITIMTPFLEKKVSMAILDGNRHKN